MKRNAKKLSLNRETLRNLQDSELKLVFGGQGPLGAGGGFDGWAPSVVMCPTPPPPDGGAINGDLNRGNG